MMITRYTFLPKGLKNGQIACGKCSKDEKVIIVYRANKSYMFTIYKYGSVVGRMLVSDKKDIVSEILLSLYPTIGGYKKMYIANCVNWFDRYGLKFPYELTENFKYIPREDIVMPDIEIIEASPIPDGFIGRVKVDGVLFDGEMQFKEEINGTIVDFSSSLYEYYEKKEKNNEEFSRFYNRIKRGE